MFRAPATGRRHSAPVSRPGSRPAPRLARAEGLEARTLLATFVVNTVDDAGQGSLRQAILDANVTTGADTINFNIPGLGAVRSIRPLSALPEVTGPTTIEGRSQAGVVVELDGSLAGPGVSGLTVSGSQSILRGLVINRFGGHGIALGPATVAGRPGPVPSGIRVESNLIGTDWTGAFALGNGGAGIMNNANATVIGVQNTPTGQTGRNVISGNGFAGIWVTGLPGPSQGPGIFGNYIGTNAGGSRALPNAREGILIENSSNTTIGGTSAATRNVISGNAASGIRVGSPGGTILVQNNYIGTDAGGAGAIPNGWSPSLPYRDGITLQSPSGTVRIGLPQPSTIQTSARNVISGNGGAGVAVQAGGDVQIVGNYIGTDATGSSDVGNAGDGVLVTYQDVPANVSRLTGNLISGNDGDGVEIGGAARVVAFGGNFIGTNAAGNAALGNRGNGVLVGNGGSPGMSIGAPGLAPTPLPGNLINPSGTTRNVISANGGHGILLLGGGVRSGPGVRMVVNNYVGTDYTGTVALGNGGSGIHMNNVANVIVGGTGTSASGIGNLVSANGGNGITILASQLPGALAANNRIEGNRIGTAAAAITPSGQLDPGTNMALGNRGHGIAVFHSVGNRIGTGQAAGGNVIAYNDGSGVLVEGAAGQTLGGTPVSTASTLISANGIYANGGLGIDLSVSGEGVTPNDPRDADSGPNGLQNHPIITEAISSATGTSVQLRFVLLSEPGRPFRIEFFASPLPDPTGYGEGRTFLGSVNVTTDPSGSGSGTFTVPTLAPGSVYFTATATQNNVVTSEFSPAVRATPAQPPTPQNIATVFQRRVFYNNSVFDGNDPAVTAQDLAAIASDKTALRPGGIASFANVSSYARGINGVEVMFESVSGTLGPIGADDFEFRVGNTPSPGEWVAAPAPTAVSLIPIPGPNRMYGITWADGAIRNTWLEVTIKANADTGLALPDVFYFGSLAGETGDAATPFRVGALDLAGTRANPTTAASITDPHDFNRDGRVNALDVALVRANYNQSIIRLAIPIPGTGGGPDDSEEPITEQVLG